MSALVFYAIATLLTSFVCSLSEATILSVSPAYTALLEKKGRKSGRLLAHWQANIDMPLAAVLTFNTIANTVGAMLIGREAQHIWGDTVVAVASGLLTFVILIFAEIMPKTIGAIYAKKLAPAVAYLVTALVYVTLPIVYISRLFKTLFSTE